MAEQNMDDKNSKNKMPYTKCIPNHVSEFGESSKVYSCIDCGNRFVLESSYQDHVNRKSVLINYMCRLCGEVKIFYNRCNLINHIRSHCSEMAIISLKDLNVESLPQSYLNVTSPSENNSIQESKTTCCECKQDISFSGVVHTDRERHFMQMTNEIYKCPVCLYPLPTECGLKVHLRLHLNCPPYYCTKCGVELSNEYTRYPYNHECEGFNTMRASTRLKCQINEKCPLFHPNDYEEHMRQNHLKKVYKCQICNVVSYDESLMQNHIESHSGDKKALIFYECELCPGRLVVHDQTKEHLKCYISPITYPCWTCGVTYKEVNELLLHHINEHLNCDINLSQMFLSVMCQHNIELNKRRRYYVVKRCDYCKKIFIYKCTHGKITILPKICPGNCLTGLQLIKIFSDGFESSGSESMLICYMCKSEISQSWEEIKKHYAIHHKKYRCLDIKVNLTKIDINKYINEGINKKKTPKMKDTAKNSIKGSILKEIKITEGAKREEPIANIADERKCNKCDFRCGTRKILEEHIITHKVPVKAYQCMECAQRFIGKSSFSVHLLSEHNITNVYDYFISKPLKY